MTTMKAIRFTIATAFLALVMPGALCAADDDGQDHAEKVAGPNGGRVVTNLEPHYELFITAERKLKITFLGDDGKPAAVQGQVITAAGGDRAKPTRMNFARDGDSLVSDKPLPEGKVVPLILQVKIAADAKPVFERINVNLSDCPECKHKEYACTCEPDEHDEHEGHTH